MEEEKTEDLNRFCKYCMRSPSALLKCLSMHLINLELSNSLCYI